MNHNCLPGANVTIKTLKNRHKRDYNGHYSITAKWWTISFAYLDLQFENQVTNKQQTYNSKASEAD
jgi:hypothetical protein